MQKYRPRVMASMQQHAFSCSKLTLLMQNRSMHWEHNISQMILFKTFKIGWLINQIILPAKSKSLIWIWPIYLSTRLSSPKKRMTPKYYANSIFSLSFEYILHVINPDYGRKIELLSILTGDTAKSYYICQQKLFSYS